jgi:NTP pyrophosphatase (non-canonical NTP hydrolase)
MEEISQSKNLAESICIEASELLVLFQWLTAAKSKNLNKDPINLRLLSSELPDILIYCFTLANVVRVDVSGSALSKLKESSRRYPTSSYKGKAPVTTDRSTEKSIDESGIV